MLKNNIIMVFDNFYNFIRLYNQEMSKDWITTILILISYNHNNYTKMNFFTFKKKNTKDEFISFYLLHV